jgi:NAD(P)-dependent dehydrogenase (short-subunit alcohol dehydrogenase family)
MTRKLSDAVVVITGASSGIGRASALKFAERGATVVVAARRDRALSELANECRRAGGRALVVPTDVTDENAVKDLARRAIESFGRIDVWVNNAGVSLFGRFEEVPPDAYRRVIETNLFGYIHGARAVLPYMREQGSGVIINNSSMVGTVGQPYASAYVTSKWAVRGLSECLRMELSLDDARNIHVCTIMPAAIDTPIFQHAGNYSGRAIKAMNPVYDAEMVANDIVGLAEHPRREHFSGMAGRLIAMQHTMAPGMTEAMLARQVNKDHFRDQPADPTTGNLFEPMPHWTGVSGGWTQRDRGGVGQTAMKGVAIAAPAIVVWWLFRPRLSNVGPAVSAIAAFGLSLMRSRRESGLKRFVPLALTALVFGRARQETGLRRLVRPAVAALGLSGNHRPKLPT